MKSGRPDGTGDAIIDGGNSYYKDDVRRSKILKEKGIHYLDVGTSGGVWGIERGYCMMLGGSEGIGPAAGPDFQDAGSRAWATSSPTRAAPTRRAPPSKAICIADPSGAGHFVKMVHNGIEYGLMQAYGEGFDIMKQRQFEGAARRSPL